MAEYAPDGRLRESKGTPSGGRFAAEPNKTEAGFDLATGSEADPVQAATDRLFEASLEYDAARTEWIDAHVGEHKRNLPHASPMIDGVDVIVRNKGNGEGDTGFDIEFDSRRYRVAKRAGGSLRLIPLDDDNMASGTTEVFKQIAERNGVKDTWERRPGLLSEVKVPAHERVEAKMSRHLTNTIGGTHTEDGRAFDPSAEIDPEIEARYWAAEQAKGLASSELTIAEREALAHSKEERDRAILNHAADTRHKLETEIAYWAQGAQSAQRSDRAAKKAQKAWDDFAAASVARNRSGERDDAQTEAELRDLETVLSIVARKAISDKEEAGRDLGITPGYEMSFPEEAERARDRQRERAQAAEFATREVEQISQLIYNTRRSIATGI